MGTSGWVYKHWVGIFYPPELRQTGHLDYYSRHFDTVEVNYSFYRLPSREVFAGWRAVAPEGFLFAVKASRYLTHRKRLKEPDEPAQRLLEAVAGLEEKQGPILFQFPPDWSKNVDRLAGLLAVLPKEKRYTFEFRHPSWLSEDVFGLLSEHNCALCIPDSPGMPQALQLTADFSYLRFHHGQRSANYEQEELETWAERIRRLLVNGDVFAYFNNDVSGYAIKNAKALRSLLPG